MLPADTWVFDLEIARAIPQKGVPFDPGIRYCQHWGDHAGMGISVLVAARPDGSEMQAFSAEVYKMPDILSPLYDFWQIAYKASLLVGYGSRFFDAKVLAAFGMQIAPAKHLDFLHEAKKKLRNAAPKGYKLHDVSQRCGGPGKSDTGSLAPILWQQGQHQRVLDYCKNDVTMICAIAQHYAVTGGCIPSASPGYNLAAGPTSSLQLRTPQQIAMEDE